jgi:hypothetical protein
LTAECLVSKTTMTRKTACNRPLSAGTAGLRQLLLLLCYYAVIDDTAMCAEQGGKGRHALAASIDVDYISTV